MGGTTSRIWDLLVGKRGGENTGFWGASGEKVGRGLRISGTKEWENSFGFWVPREGTVPGFSRPEGIAGKENEGGHGSLILISWAKEARWEGGQATWPESQWVYYSISKKAEFLPRSSTVLLCFSSRFKVTEHKRGHLEKIVTTQTKRRQKTNQNVAE